MPGNQKGAERGRSHGGWQKSPGYRHAIVTHGGRGRYRFNLLHGHSDRMPNSNARSWELICDMEALRDGRRAAAWWDLARWTRSLLRSVRAQPAPVNSAGPFQVRQRSTAPGPIDMRQGNPNRGHLGQETVGAHEHQVMLPHHQRVTRAQHLSRTLNSSPSASEQHKHSASRPGTWGPPEKMPVWRSTFTAANVQNAWCSSRLRSRLLPVPGSSAQVLPTVAWVVRDRRRVCPPT